MLLCGYVFFDNIIRTVLFFANFRTPIKSYTFLILVQSILWSISLQFKYVHFSYEQIWMSIGWWFLSWYVVDMPMVWIGPTFVRADVGNIFHVHDSNSLRLIYSLLAIWCYVSSLGWNIFCSLEIPLFSGWSLLFFSNLIKKFEINCILNYSIV